MSKRITARSIDAVLPFLDVFDAEGFKPGEWSKPEDGQLPWFDWSEALTRFVEALERNGWIEPFDWPSWQDEAQEYANSPERTATADVDVIRKLLTTHVRKERFCEGHLLAMFESGHIVNVLRRLKRLRSTMAGQRARKNPQRRLAQ